MKTGRDLPVSDHLVKARAAGYAANYDDALHHFATAIADLDFSSREDRRTAAGIRLEAADALFKLRRLEHARCTALRGLVGLRRTDGAPRLQAYGQNLLGITAWRVNGPSAALPHFLEAVGLLEQETPPADGQLIDAWDHLGLALHSIGRHEDAVRYLRDAAELARTSGTKLQQVRTRRRLANALQDAGHFAAAADAMLQIEPGSDSSVADRIAWLNPAAMLAEQMEDFATAKDYYDEALQLFPCLPASQQDDMAAVLSNAALLYVDLGLHGEAEELLEQHVAVLNENSSLTSKLGPFRVRARLAAAHGDMAGAIGQWAQAEVLISSTAGGDRSKLAEIVATRAELLWRDGQTAAAIEALTRFIQSASQVPVEPHDVEPMVQLARFQLDLGELAQTGDLLRRAFIAEIVRRQAETEWKLMAAIADWAEASGQRSAAILFGKLAVATIGRSIARIDADSSNRRSLLETRIHPFRQLLDRLVWSNRIAEATAVQDMLKSERFFQFISRDTRIVDRGSPGVSFRQAEERLARSYRDVGDRLGRQRTADLLRSERGKFVPVVADRRAEPEGLLDEMLSETWVPQPTGPSQGPTTESLDDGTAVAYFIAGARETAVHVRTAHASSAHIVAMSPEDLATRIFAFRQAILDLSPDYQDLAQSLFEALLRPAEELLSGTERLEVSVDGALSHLPFACLHDGCHHLVERLSIATRTSARPPLSLPVPRSRWRIAAFAAAHETGEFPALDYALNEIRHLRDLRPDTSVWVDAEFTRASLEEAIASKPQLLHIATHYHLEPGAPHRSYLFLGDQARLPLDALRDRSFDLSGLEVLVLAGCNTATPDAGESSSQESFASLAQARGARRVIGTLWAIPDDSAAAIMAPFYRTLIADGSSIDAADALRSAQLHVMGARTPAGSCSVHRVGGLGPRATAASFAHPYFWAGFATYVPAP